MRSFKKEELLAQIKLQSKLAVNLVSRKSSKIDNMLIQDRGKSTKYVAPPIVLKYQLHYPHFLHRVHHCSRCYFNHRWMLQKRIKGLG